MAELPAVGEPYEFFILGTDFPPGLNTATPAYDLEANETPDGFGFDLDKDDRLVKGVTSTPTLLSRVAVAAPNWASSTVYEVPQIVTVAGTETNDSRIIYVANVPHTSSSAFSTDSSKWDRFNMRWSYNRLWAFKPSSKVLEYGARLYDDKFFKQGFGIHPFSEDTQDIIALEEFKPDRMFVAKTKWSYVITNCSDPRAFFSYTDIIREMFVEKSVRITELNDEIWVSNTNGLHSFSGGTTIERFRKIRDDLTDLDNLPLFTEPSNKRIFGGTGKAWVDDFGYLIDDIVTVSANNASYIALTNHTSGGSFVIGSNWSLIFTFVYEIETDKIFKYKADQFRYTSRQIHEPDYSQFQVDSLIFTVEHSNTSGGTLKYQVRFEDTPFSKTYTMKIPFRSERLTEVREDIERGRSCRRFQLRITSLSSNIFIKEIKVDHKKGSHGNYAN